MKGYGSFKAMTGKSRRQRARDGARVVSPPPVAGFATD